MLRDPFADIDKPVVGTFYYESGGTASPMRNASELEQMTNLIALAADVMRKLAKGQDQEAGPAIIALAEDLESVADRLVDVLYPQLVKRHISERTEGP